MAAPSEGRDWQRLIRAAGREACETWCIQTQAGPVTADALDAIIHRAAVPVLSRLQDEPPEIVVALVPNLVRVMPRGGRRGDGGGAQTALVSPPVWRDAEGRTLPTRPATDAAPQRRWLHLRGE